MSAEREGKEVRLSRRKMILGSGVAILALLNGGVLVARRAGWTKKIGAFLASLSPTRSVELKFTGPFENDKSLLDKPLENEWVSVGKNVGCIVFDESSKSQDLFQIYFDFSGEKTKGWQRHLVNPYKIAFAVFIKDDRGEEHAVVDKVVDYDPGTYELQLGGGLTHGGGESSYGGVFKLPVKVKDASAIRVQLSKVSS